eukprot:6165348-Alexandrium_andersonii.AAC.1
MVSLGRSNLDDPRRRQTVPDRAGHCRTTLPDRADGTGQSWSVLQCVPRREHGGWSSEDFKGLPGKSSEGPQRVCKDFPGGSSKRAFGHSQKVLQKMSAGGSRGSLGSGCKVPGRVGTIRRWV